MRVKIYKGESLSIIFTTPEQVPRVKVTDYTIEATVQGQVPYMEILNDYSFRLFLRANQTVKFDDGVIPIIVTLKQDNLVKIGKNINLFAVDPQTRRPINSAEEDNKMSLSINTGDIEFGLDLTHYSRSPYQQWLDNGFVGTEMDFLEWLRIPATQAGLSVQEAWNVLQASIDSEINIRYTQLGNLNSQYTSKLLSIDVAISNAEDAATQALLARQSAAQATTEALTAANTAAGAGIYAQAQGDYAKEVVLLLVSTADSLEQVRLSTIQVRNETQIVKEQASNAAIAANNAAVSANAAALTCNQVKNETEIVKQSTIQVRNDTLQIKNDTLQVKNDTLQVKNDTLIVKQAAELATTNANQATVNANNAATDANNARILIEQNEETRQTQETTRQENETTRGTNEETRQTQETTRQKNEEIRNTAEDLRVQAETSRNITSNLYNVTAQVPLPAGQFYTSTTARAAVPTGVRKRGLILTYETSAGIWYTERFIGTDTVNWTTEGNWIVLNDYDATEKAAVANSVRKTGNETIAGIKTFSSSPIVPAPTTDLQPATKKYVDDAVAASNENWVGVIIDPNSSTSEPAPKSTVVAYRATELQRTGNLYFHKFGKSRIFNAIYPAIVVRSTRKVAWKLDKNDFTKKDDGSVSVPDWTIHNICIVIPQLWRRIVLLDGVDTGRYEVRYDIAPFEGAEVFCNETAHSIGFASMDRTTTQLVSVISNDVRFRGGNNTSTNDANPWNWNSFLGKPATVISRTGFENNAAAAGWETGNIWDRTLWQQLMWLYFANTNIQLAYTSVLTAEGYPQGGLGAGVTNWSSFRWNAKNGAYPINTVGAGSLSVGCKVGVRNMVDDRYYIGQATGVAANSIVATSHFSTANGWSASYIGLTVQNMTTLAEATIISKTDDSTLVLSADIFPTSGQWFWIKGVNHSYQIPVFFGIEHLYGELWEWVSGINIEKQAVADGAVSRAFICKDFSKRSAAITADYRLVGLVPRTDGFIKTLYPEFNIARVVTGSSSTTFISDYAYMTTFPSSGVGVYGCLFGGFADSIGFAGSGCVSAYYAPSFAFTGFGSRLRAEIVK